jgi:16S rRNA (cytosine967-C5)-methyltransferase
LIDAPCSGTGVIRRHPDIKFLRSENNIIGLVKTQKQILESLWPLLKNGGTLLYSTCSILKRENSTQINDFLYRHRGDAVLSDMIQALPGENEQDGFFYAKIKKRLN